MKRAQKNPKTGMKKDAANNRPVIATPLTISLDIGYQTSTRFRSETIGIA
jgi:hypothetical protein